MSIIRQTLTVWLKYGLYPIWCKDRTEMAEYIYEYFMAVERMKEKGETVIV